MSGFTPFSEKKSPSNEMPMVEFLLQHVLEFFFQNSKVKSCQILPNLTESHKSHLISLNLIESYQMSQNLIKSCQFSPYLTESHHTCISLNLTKCKLTKCHWIMQNLTESHKTYHISLNFTKSHHISLYLKESCPFSPNIKL